MLKMASDNFDKVVVLLNTQNPMELADLEDDSIDAVMWIGSLGQTGAGGVAEALNGTVNRPPARHLRLRPEIRPVLREFRFVCHRQWHRPFHLLLHGICRRHLCRLPLL